MVQTVPRGFPKKSFCQRFQKLPTNQPTNRDPGPGHLQLFDWTFPGKCQEAAEKKWKMNSKDFNNRTLVVQQSRPKNRGVFCAKKLMSSTPQGKSYKYFWEGVTQVLEVLLHVNRLYYVCVIIGFIFSLKLPLTICPCHAVKTPCRGTSHWMSLGILSAWNATWPEAKLWTAPPRPVETLHEDIDFFATDKNGAWAETWVGCWEGMGPSVSLYYLPIYGDSAFMYRWIGWFECKSEI